MESQNIAEWIWEILPNVFFGQIVDIWLAISHNLSTADLMPIFRASAPYRWSDQKWVGKTAASERHAASSFLLTPHAGDADPLERPFPCVQRAEASSHRRPASLAIHMEHGPFSVDESMGAKGLYKLTGSALPPQRDTSARGAIRHTGARRLWSSSVHSPKCQRGSTSSEYSFLDSTACATLPISASLIRNNS